MLFNFLGGKLAVGFVGCDGGSKDESSPPKNVLSDNWTTEGSVYAETTAMTPKFSFSSWQTVYHKRWTFMLQVISEFGWAKQLTFANFFVIDCPHLLSKMLN
jgi:hypothetical protein